MESPRLKEECGPPLRFDWPSGTPARKKQAVRLGNQFDFHDPNGVTVCVEIPNDLNVLVLVLLDITLFRQLISCVRGNLENKSTAVSDNLPRKRLSRGLLILGICRWLGLLILALVRLRHRSVTRRKWLRRRLRFLQMRPRDQLLGRERILGNRRRAYLWLLSNGERSCDQEETSENRHSIHNAYLRRRSAGKAIAISLPSISIEAALPYSLSGRLL